MKKILLLPLTALLLQGSLHAEASVRIDTNALALLKRMSDTLSNAKSFTFRSDSILEMPYATGQLITVISEGQVAVHRPNKIMALYAGDAHSFGFLYDGSSVTAVAPQAKAFSTSKAPGTIDEMLTGLRGETGIHLHSAPLLYKDPYAHLTRNIRSAAIIGRTFVNGVPCDHLAFRSPGVDWEIWISSGKVALPYRLASTFTDKPGLPRKFIDFSSWNLRPWISSTLFTFRKPKDFQEIPFQNVLQDVRKEAVRGSNH